MGGEAKARARADRPRGTPSKALEEREEEPRGVKSTSDHVEDVMSLKMEEKNIYNKIPSCITCINDSLSFSIPNG